MPLTCRVLIAVLAVGPTASVWAQSLRIYHIDVDQGDSTLFVAPGGKTLLVDSGRDGHGPRIQRVMATAGVSQIDFYVTTHYHADHYGGIDDLVDAGVHVLEAYDRGDKQFLPAAKSNESAYKGYLRTVGEDAITLRRGTTLPLDPKMTVTAISQGGVVIGEQNPVTAQDENDMSVSLLVTFGAFRYFVGGDIEAPTEEKIAARDLVMDVDVYQADHHGSDTSSAVDFLSDLKPTVVIISNGDRGDYQHPRQVILNRFAAMNPMPAVFQTNKYTKGGAGGNVPDGFIADLDSPGDEGTILVTVDAAVQAYTVAYGTQTRTFMVKAAPSHAASVVIESLLPNPVGNDDELETVTLRNAGASPVSLAGWVLEDRAGGKWDLTQAGMLAAGQSISVVRHGMAMSLNNAGDEVMLRDSGNVPVDSFQYDASTEGVVIQTGH